MKIKQIIAGLLVLCAANGRAAVNMPADFSSDFGNTGLEGWTMSATDATPAGDYASIFASGDAFVTYPTPYGTAVMSCSEFEDGSASDAWLISPEFEVTSDNMLLYYTVCTYGSTVNNKFTIKISEGGADKEDFKATAVNNLIQGKGNTLARMQKFFVLKGYKGKTIRLAFINSSNKYGMTGIEEIGVAPYYVSISNPARYANLVLESGAADLTMRIGLTTPGKVNGFEASLEIEGERIATYKDDKTYNASQLFETEFTFEDVIDFTGSHEYSINIAPAIEGVPPVVVSGNLIVAPRLYDPVVFIEEATSLGCVNCPRGIAFLNYFHDKYDGRNGNGLVISSSIHTNFGTRDPMMIDGNGYYNGLVNLMTPIDAKAAQYLPIALVNREIVCDPSEVKVDELLSAKSIATVSIRRVDYSGERNGAVKVSFEPKLSYSTSDACCNAAAIVIENGLSNPNWKQKNGFSGIGLDLVAATYGAELIEYFRPIVEAGDPAMGLVYNEVARGILPGLEGAPIEGAWEADKPRYETLEFDMPSEVADWNNTDVIVIITDRASGNVIAADRVSASDYNKDISDTEDVRLCPVDQTSPSAIYNLQGIPVGRDLNGLPSGIYIVDGKKIAI